MPCGAFLLALGELSLLAASAPSPGERAFQAAPASTAPEGTATTTTALESLRARIEALESTLAAQELEKGLQSEREPVAAEEEALLSAPMLRLYGFAEVGLQRLFASDGALVHAVAPTAATTFVMGNLNLYFDAQPTTDWRALIEVRLTNLPNGVDTVGTPGDPYRRVQTTVYDASAPSGGAQAKYGSIVIERAIVQWLRYSWLEVTAGAFLTPFGIWNVDHGTPVLISLMLPQLVVGELFPTHQVGLQASGRVFLSDLELGYHLYVSNGRTPGELSLSEGNKLVGGRLTVTLRDPLTITFGASGYFNHGVDRSRELATVDPLTFARPETVAYNEGGEAVDIALDAGPLRLRSELALRQRYYESGKRAPDPLIPGAFTPDQVDWDFYFLAAYQLPWAGIEPYVYLEAYRYPNTLGDGYIVPSAGFNIHFTPNAQLKAQYMHGFAFADILKLKRVPGTSGDAGLLGVRLVLAF